MTMPMQGKLAWVMAGGTALALCSCVSPVVRPSSGGQVSIEQIASGIEKNIAEQTRANGGDFKLQYGDKELQLKLVIKN